MDQINPKTAWWRQHKNDPKILECMREARRKYYYKNREQEKARSLARYYTLKGRTPATADPDPDPVEN